ncbi:hypothetical protein [Streptococcus acidominimus]|uniref:Phage protein n=1 Tax=Streptococcus acidominimus TaxID=1326 RepID=A0A1Q8EFT8_STRAI|nr:hypothetical protein [Streptococcus acidominimus]OLF50654.1 hypothetical protein BU200_01135 [Streptococcus acidominimus]QBX13677.1 hypothetical protein Javan1_0037 [Streptococcus phage Javan1]SUN05069.1 Uncharacterised protein [Streptococcus acidominimus]
MHYKVKKEFTDNELGYQYPVGADIDITPERYNEMRKNAELQDVKLSDYIEEIKEKSASTK